MKKVSKYNPNNHLFLKRQFALAIVLGLLNLSFRVGWEPTIVNLQHIEPDTFGITEFTRSIPPVRIERELEEEVQDPRTSGPILIVQDPTELPDKGPADNLFDPNSIKKPDLSNNREEEPKRIILEDKGAQYPGGMEHL